MGNWVCPLVSWETSTSLEVILSPTLTRVANAILNTAQTQREDRVFLEKLQTVDSW